MLIVKVQNGNIDRALKSLKKKVRDTKQRENLREQEEFTKPSVKKRKEKMKAIYVHKKFEDEDV